MSTLAAFVSADRLFDWDLNTSMASGARRGREGVIETFAGLAHREASRPDVDDMLSAIDEDATSSAELRRMVQLARRLRRRTERLSAEFEGELAVAAMRSSSIWTDARPRNDFAMLSEPLARLVSLKRQEASLLDVGDEPYDGLLDQFEPGARVSEILPLFDQLSRPLAELAGAARRHEPRVAGLHWDADGQLALAREVAVALGYEPERGGFGISPHPFASAIHAGDVRISTRVNPLDPNECLLSTMHEVGHAIYDQALPESLAGTLLWDAPSHGAHESQARFWENHVGRDEAFWEWLAPHVIRHFPEQSRTVPPAELFAETRAVRPSLIRTDADEVTYNLHIILRLEIELALIRGDIEVTDLPNVWDRGMERLLGIRPDSDADGVMQDSHWPAGDFGYFPSYTLGNIYAAQLAEALGRECGTLTSLIRAGSFATIADFMRRRLHQHGQRFDADEIMARATGEPRSTDALVRHLRQRYAQ